MNYVLCKPFLPNNREVLLAVERVVKNELEVDKEEKIASFNSITFISLLKVLLRRRPLKRTNEDRGNGVEYRFVMETEQITTLS
jgi:hypothetical protein